MVSDKKAKLGANKNDNHHKERKLFDMFDPEDQSWEPYTKADEFLDFISPGGEDPLTARDHQVMYKEPPFYNGVQLIHVTPLVPSDFPEEDINIFFLKNSDHIVMLNGNCAYIHEMNETGVLNLNGETVFDYLKFFCAFNVIEETMEPFLVIESANSEYLKGMSKYEISRAMRSYKGARVIASADNKDFMIETRVMYCNDLYDVKFKITNDGDVIMTDDTAVGAL
ncbi:MAG: hypothetical protein H6869_01630 [Rhodospirillales bacterium]|nr:hypothetical protein [Rhodospirillales bacterium]